MGADVFASRELGEKLPISIGTALALETLLDPIIPTPWSQGRVEYLYLNLHTLFRNLYGSLTALDKIALYDIDYAQVLAKELIFIKEFLLTKAKGTKLVAYCPTYDGLMQKYKFANVKTTNTPKQKEYVAISTATLKVLIKDPQKFQQQLGIPLEVTDYKPPKNMERNCAIMTHHPVELLYSPVSTVLLESHTGKYKKYSEWNTKLGSSSDTSHMPFNALTLQVFGDGVDFGPMDRKVKAVVLALAEERKWTSVTTKDRILVSLDLMKDRISAERLKLLLLS